LRERAIDGATQIFDDRPGPFAPDAGTLAGGCPAICASTA